MAAPHLRVYPLTKEPAPSAERDLMVRVSLGELLPLVAIAHRNNYIWLQDFLDDEVAITPDLYEVLLAHFGRIDQHKDKYGISEPRPLGSGAVS